jgi:hypothetical protein
MMAVVFAVLGIAAEFAALYLGLTGRDKAATLAWVAATLLWTLAFLAK